MARIVIPQLEDVPFIPGIQVEWWVDSAILPRARFL
jgi:hypothetical protein